MYRVEKAGTQPKPLPARDRNFGAAEYLGSMSGVRRDTFDPIGQTVVWQDRSRSHPPNNDFESTLWSPDLLRFDPEGHRLRFLARGKLEIYETTNQNRADIIDPVNTRPVINDRSGAVEVREGGYVLPPNGYLSPSSYKEVPAETILQMIEDAKKGKELPLMGHAMRLAYPRVDLPVGSMVEMLTLYGWTTIHSDMVIIDPSKRKLVEREIVHPFTAPNTK